MAKHYIIYETKNLIDGKIYIGMHETDNLNDGYLGSGKRLKRAIRYYGKEFFGDLIPENWKLGRKIK